jgi:NADH:ubiquinone oxidoreductase subunit 6 (subunit J)
MVIIKKSVGVLLLLYLLGLAVAQVFILTNVDFQGVEQGLGGMVLVLVTTLFVVIRMVRTRWFP